MVTYTYTKDEMPEPYRECVIILKTGNSAYIGYWDEDYWAIENKRLDRDHVRKWSYTYNSVWDNIEKD